MTQPNDVIGIHNIIMLSNNLFNIKTYTILRNGNKHLSKKKCFSLKRDVINLRDDVITPFYDLKSLGSVQRCQSNIFVLEGLLKNPVLKNLLKGKLGEFQIYFKKIPLHQQHFLVISVLSNSP